MKHVFYSYNAFILNLMSPYFCDNCAILVPYLHRKCAIPAPYISILDRENDPTFPRFMGGGGSR